MLKLALLFLFPGYAREILEELDDYLLPLSEIGQASPYGRGSQTLGREQFLMGRVAKVNTHTQTELIGPGSFVPATADLFTKRISKIQNQYFFLSLIHAF